MTKKFLQARQLYNQLLEIIKKVDNNENIDYNDYLNIFKSILKKFISVLDKIDINYIDVSPITRTKLIKELNTMIDDVEAFKWQYKYWEYYKPLMDKSKWVYNIINDEYKKDLNKKGISIPNEIKMNKINEFLNYLISFENLFIYENDVKRIIRGSYTEKSLYRLFKSCQNNLNNLNNLKSLQYKSINDIYDLNRLISTYNNKIISSDELQLIYYIIINKGWKSISVINSKFNNNLNNDNLLKIYNFIKNNNKYKIKILFNKNINNLLIISTIKNNFLLTFIDLSNKDWYNDFKSIIKNFNLNEGFSNPFNNASKKNLESTEPPIINNTTKNLIKDVKLWNCNERLNKIKCVNNKIFANTKFFKDDIVEEAPVIILSNEDLYTKNIRNIVFDISPNKFGIPLGYTSLYRKSSDTNKKHNLDFKYDLENNKLIFIANRNIDEGEELIINDNKIIYDNQLKEDSFVDSLSPSVYNPSDIGIVNIKALSDINSGYPPISGGM